MCEKGSSLTNIMILITGRNPVRAPIPQVQEKLIEDAYQYGIYIIYMISFNHL